MLRKRGGGIVTASKIMDAAIPVLSALLLGGTGVATAASSQQFVDEAEIQKLTVNYAKATDALGTGDAAQVAAGRELYRRTFTADAQVKAGESPTLTGPDAWADYVMEALSRYTTTQHLVGSIDVQLDPPQGASESSTGKMTSYLHATHESEPGGNLWIVLGTYVDEVVRTPEGWRISRRTLVFTSSETREHKPAATP
jgi:hypothetical protein